MLGPLDKYIEQLTDSLVSPVWNRILALEWFGRAAVLAALLFAGAIAVYRERVLALGREASYLVRVQWSDAKTRPLTRVEGERVGAAMARLAASLEPELTYMGKVGYAAWPTAQITVALHGIVTIDTRRVATFLQTQADTACNCWQEVPGPQSPPNIAISGWIAYGLAELNEPLTRGQLEF